VTFASAANARGNCRGGIVAAVLLGALAASGGHAEEAISYSSTFTASEGGEEGVTFNGRHGGPVVEGTLVIGGVSRRVVASIASDGSVQGKILGTDGGRIGTFQGSRGSDGLSGTFAMGERKGPWAIAERNLPPSLAATANR
jgi:hypothetical protein